MNLYLHLTDWIQLLEKSKYKLVSILSLTVRLWYLIPASSLLMWSLVYLTTRLNNCLLLTVVRNLLFWKTRGELNNSRLQDWIHLHGGYGHWTTNVYKCLTVTDNIYSCSVRRWMIQHRVGIGFTFQNMKCL